MTVYESGAIEIRPRERREMHPFYAKVVLFGGRDDVPNKEITVCLSSPGAHKALRKVARHLATIDVTVKHLWVGEAHEEWSSSASKYKW